MILKEVEMPKQQARQQANFILDVSLNNPASTPSPHNNDPHTCPVCADFIIAAETSFYRVDGSISYVWSCETCGYGFITTHAADKTSRH